MSIKADYADGAYNRERIAAAIEVISHEEVLDLNQKKYLLHMYSYLVDGEYEWERSLARKIKELREKHKL